MSLTVSSHVTFSFKSSLNIKLLNFSTNVKTLIAPGKTATTTFLCTGNRNTHAGTTRTRPLEHGSGGPSA